MAEDGKARFDALESPSRRIVLKSVTAASAASHSAKR